MSLLSPSPLLAEEVPPLTCERDAIKLFVGNVPKSFTESQLTALFETVGRVVELVVVRDKTTRQSKGSAFLWFPTRELAQKAILHFNMRFTLPGQGSKKLVVRQALARGEHQGKARQQQGSTQASIKGTFRDQLAHPHSGRGSPLRGQGGSAEDVRAKQGPCFGRGDMKSAPSGVDGGGLAPQRTGADRTTSLLINTQQLLAVEQYMYSIQTFSGACVVITAHSPGYFCLIASGSNEQAQTAHVLLSALAGSA